MPDVKAGQWWTEKGYTGKSHRIVVLGFTSKGDVVCEWNGGNASSLRLEYFLKYKEHLPECTSFEWVPEVYPQYRETVCRPNIAFFRLDSPTQYSVVYLDGRAEHRCDVPSLYKSVTNRTKLTEAEALARIKKPEPKTRTVKVHTVAYGLDKLKFVSKVLDTELDSVKRDWKVLTILKTEEFEVPCE